MDVGVGITLGLGLLAAFVAYQAGVRQDRRRWYRERRTDLYIDMLAEAYAEKQWCLNELTRRELAEIDGPGGGDDKWMSPLAAGEAKRLEPQERVRLGARGTAYGSTEANILFNAIGRGVMIPINRRRADTWDVEEAFNKFEAQIRREFSDPRRMEKPERLKP